MMTSELIKALQLHLDVNGDMPVLVDIFDRDPKNPVASGSPMGVKTTQDYVNISDREMTDHCHIDTMIW